MVSTKFSVVVLTLLCRELPTLTICGYARHNFVYKNKILIFVIITGACFNLPRVRRENPKCSARMANRLVSYSQPQIEKSNVACHTGLCNIVCHVVHVKCGIA